MALVLGLFVPAFCLAFVFVSERNRPRTGRLVAVALWSLGGALVAVVAFYWQYVPEILTRSDAAATSSELIDVSFTPVAALVMAAHRLNLFYGVLGFVALAGLYFTRGRLSHPLAGPLAGAAVATYLGMNFLRAGLGSTHIFQFSKDDLVILPVIVFVLGMLVDGWWRAGTKWGRALSLAVVVGWIAWSGLWFSKDIRGRFIRPDYPPPVRTTRSHDA